MLLEERHLSFVGGTLGLIEYLWPGILREFVWLILFFGVLFPNPRWAEPHATQLETFFLQRLICQLFEDIDLQLDVATPASVGLMTIGLRLLHSRKTPGPIILAHLGDTASLLVYVSRQAFRFCYHPRGFTKVIHETIKHCDLQFTEGRYFAEHLNEKNMPDIFMASFNNNLTRYIESLGNQMVQLANHQNNDKITILLSGGPTRVANMLPCFKRFPELDVQHLDFNTHLMNNKLVLEEGIDPHALATFSPHFVGYMESMGL